MPTAYLHLNGTDYELPANLTPNQLSELADRYAEFLHKRPSGHQIQDVLIKGARASLVVSKASVTAVAVFVVDGEPLPPPNIW